MKQLIACLFAAAVCAVPVYAQQQPKGEVKKGEPKKELTEQQKRMGDCNKQASAKGVKGDERDKFMSTCLKGGGQMTQQDKMTACNKEAGAKNLKGDDRKAFMSKCLSG
ncbi:MAG TPA: PsiF family protein [Burkholderiales bacterium]|nr:PsiF family protein [Burkholderiales bacterium]